MFQWLSKILHWRRGCEAVTKGGMVHFCPVNGCYVYARMHEGKSVLVILNGTSKLQKLPMKHFEEVVGDKGMVTDLTSGKQVDLQGILELQPRESLIIEL